MSPVRIVLTNAGGLPVGTSHRWVKYSDELVVRARQLHAEGVSQETIARTLGLAQRTVWDWVTLRRRKPPISIRVVLVPAPDGSRA